MPDGRFANRCREAPPPARQNGVTVLSGDPPNRRQHLDLLFPDGVELIGLQAERPQDRRRDLLVADRALDDRVREARMRDQQRRVNVVLVEPAVFGELRATGEDDTGVDLEDDVGCTRVNRRIVELVAQRLAGEDLLDAERLLILRLAQQLDDAGPSASGRGSSARSASHHRRCRTPRPRRASRLVGRCRSRAALSGRSAIARAWRR